MPDKTSRQPLPLGRQDLVNKVLSRLGRREMGVAAHEVTKLSYLQQGRLLRVVLLELRDHYITLPQEVRQALQEFLHAS